MLDGEGQGQEVEVWVLYCQSGVVDDMIYLIIQNWILFFFGLFCCLVCDVLGGFLLEYLLYIGDMFLWMCLLVFGKVYFIKELLGKICIYGKNVMFSLLVSGCSVFDYIYVFDLVYQFDLWLYLVCLFVKVSQICLMIGMMFYDLVICFGNEYIFLMICDYFECYCDEFYVIVVCCIFVYLSRGSGVGMVEEVILLFKVVLKISFDYVEVRMLLCLIKLLDSVEYKIWIYNYVLIESDVELFVEWMMLCWKQKFVFYLLVWLELE